MYICKTGATSLMMQIQSQSTQIIQIRKMSEREVESTMAHDAQPRNNSGESWIYSSLLEVIRPITSFATKLGTITSLYKTRSNKDWSSYQFTEEDNKRFKDIWEDADEDANIVLISLYVHTRKDDETRIDQIGVSTWFADKRAPMYSLQVHFEPDTNVQKSPLPQLIISGFLYGETQVLAESDIGPWLEDTFRASRGSQPKMCLVGHDVPHLLHLVQPYWKVPDDVTILDTRAMWGFRTQTTSLPSLEETLRVIGHEGDESLLDNAGNSARFILELLDFQIGPKKEKNERRYMDMGLNMWRSPSW